MKWLHNLLKGISLTGALFVFQACYGTERDPGGYLDNAPMSFSVVSHATGEPLEGITVSQGNQELGTTDASGKCRVELMYQKNHLGPYVHFDDQNGVYAAKDTLLADLRDREVLIKMDPGL